MSLEVGSVVKGKVTGVMKFGAFVALPEDKSGMVHISEISHEFVNDINDVIKVGDEVTVKVVSIDNGKISLSIKANIEKPAPSLDSVGLENHMCLLQRLLHLETFSGKSPRTTVVPLKI